VRTKDVDVAEYVDVEDEDEDEDEDESIESSNHDPISASFRAAVTVATSVDSAFFDSFVNSELIASNSIKRSNRRILSPELGTCVEMNEEGEVDILNGQSSLRKSSRSFDFSETYRDDTAAGNHSNNSSGPFTRNHRTLRCGFYGLLILSGILTILAVSNFKTTAYSYLNLLVIAALAVDFVIYDSRMRRRESLLIESINRSEAIVNSLFPEIVRDRILEEGNWSESKLKPTATKFSNVDPASVVNDKRNFYIPNATNAIIEVDNNNRNDSNSDDDSDHTYSNSGSNTEPSTKNQSPPLLASPKQKRRKSNRSVDSSSNTTDYDVSGKGDNVLDLSYQTHQKRPGNSILPNSNHSSLPMSSSRPIADYFPSATIMFADIVGFTSWASIREPAQVFELLETVYGRFDKIAKRKGVFKVETIGDCYVAATGLPNAMNDHAVAMASFARRCLETMLETVADLEKSLGPGTADLGMRVGIHSGSVIGGVLRGSKSRYQLFGDTMNTASRIESTSSRNKIQLSEQTAELILEAGKKLWVEPRDDTIFAKGKGELKTYWLSTEAPKNLSAKEAKALPVLLKMMEKANIDPGFIKKKKVFDPNRKRKRLVDYHTNVLKGLLKKLAAIRDYSDASFRTKKVETLSAPCKRASVTKTFAKGQIPEFPTSVQYKTFANTPGDSELHNIDASVSKQLRELIIRVSRWYRDDRPFHTFEHASHTVLSVTKFVSAIKTDDSIDDRVLNIIKSMITHPLTQFVLIFAALVHDTGDEKVGEPRLVAAEKSTRRAWSLFLEPAFSDLRSCVCKNRSDLEFFRRLLGKSITAVKAEAADTIQISNEGSSIDWSRPGKASTSTESQAASRKAMAIVETLLRVSDVSYAIQHFPVFKKWNKLLFQEIYARYKSKSSTAEENTIIDPSLTWYERELESFDDRILLVKELRDSGVFNKLADVYLSTAIANRREWKEKGEPMIQDYLLSSKRRNSGST